MKLTRIRKVALSTFAVVALAGAGAGAVFAVEPGATSTTGVEATEAVTEAPGTGVEVGVVGGWSDTNNVDANTQQTGDR